jgi:hypothetical protein
MIERRAIMLSTLLLGTLWAGCLVLTGLYALGLGGGWQSGTSASWWAGAAALAAGNFVFMEVVADRLMPAAPRPMITVCEAAAAVAMLAALAVAAALWLGESGAA